MKNLNLCQYLIVILSRKKAKYLYDTLSNGVNTS